MQRPLVKSFAPLHELSSTADRVSSLSVVAAVGMSGAPLLFSVGLTRSHLVLASLFLHHRAAWGKAEQTPVFLNSL